MQRARHQFLAGARLAAHQHRRHAARHLDDALLDGLHGVGRADHLLQCLRATRRALGRRRGAARRPGRLRRTAGGLDRRGRHGAELLQVHRLGQIVEGAGLQGLDGVFRRAVGRHHDAALGALVLAQVDQQVEPRAVGQPHVGDHRVEALLLQLGLGLVHRGRGFHAVAFAQQGQLVQRAQVGLVVDDQHVGVGAGGGCGSHQTTMLSSGAGCVPTLLGLRKATEKALPSIRAAGRAAHCTPVADGCAVAFAQLAADVQAQAGGAAFGGEERLEQVLLHRLFQRLAVAPDLQRGLAAGRQAGGHLQRIVVRADVAPRVVQQVDEHAAQVVGLELHAGLRRLQLHAHAAPLAGLAAPVAADGVHRVVQRQRRRRRQLGAVLHPRDVQHLFGDLGQPLGVLPHHQRQPLVGRIVQVFIQQRIGLHDGGQRVADFVRDGSRHAAHGRQLLGAQPRFHLAQVVQEDHAQVAGAELLRAGHARAHAHTARAVAGVVDHDVAGLRLAVLEGGARQVQQRPPGGFGGQGERVVGGGAGTTQQLARRRVGGARRADARRPPARRRTRSRSPAR